MFQLKENFLNRVKLGRISLTLFFCLSAQVFLFAGPQTTIRGRVTDQANSQPLAGAAVKIYNLSGALVASAQTNTSGNYQIIKELSSGMYILRASLAGYETATTSATFLSGRTYVINFSLKKQNSPPKITALLPKNISSFTCGEAINITIEAVDPDNDRLYYRFLWDGVVIRGWSVSCSFTLQTGSQHLKRHKIKGEVKDNRGGSDSKASDVYVFAAFPKPGI